MLDIMQIIEFIQNGGLFFIAHMFDITQIIEGGGLLLIALIVFAESGMFVGFFLPGDTLLLTAGIFAAQGKLSLATVIVVVTAAAIAGDNCGYYIGRRYGRRLFDKEDGLFFRRDQLQRAESFFDKFGSRAMLFAHFVPIVRTFAPPAAGIAGMPRKRFVIYDAVGIIAWAVLVTLVGYWFGARIPDIDKYILIFIVIIMVVSIVPSLHHVHKTVRKQKRRKKESAAE